MGKQLKRLNFKYFKLLQILNNSWSQIMKVLKDNRLTFTSNKCLEKCLMHQLAN